MVLYLGSDHAGFEAKERMKRWLARHHRIVDVGPKTFEPLDDYPDYAVPLARAVAKTNGRGILFCSSGIGVCMAANKVAGVRAGVAWSTLTGQRSRSHDNTNVLCVPTKVSTIDPPEKIIAAWLSTKFSGAVRHKRRLKKVAALETK